jgi:phosphoribosylglycinamide formyltransferase-1
MSGRSRPLALGVLVSGTGTNLQAILDAIAARTLDARVAVVVSNVPGAGALDRGRRSGADAVVVDHTDYADRNAFDEAVLEVLRAHDVELVVLAGFMRLLGPVLLEAFPMRIVNVHPALLPSFPGVHAQKDALDHGVRVTGCTVHFVDAGTDTGPIVAQAAVPVLDGDDVDTLRRRILAREHELLPRVLQWIAEGRVALEAVERRRPRVRVLGAQTALGVDIGAPEQGTASPPSPPRAR